MKLISCLLFSIVIFSQAKPLELKIDSINTSTTKENDRKYILHYHLTNLSGKPVSFVLDTKHIIPIDAGSLRANPYYKIYENDKSFDASGIFMGEKTRQVFNDEKSAQAFRDSLVHSFESKTPEQKLAEKKEDFLNNIQKLEPKETVSFNVVLIWKKQRYFKNGVMEYYIEEKTPYFFELQINLMREALIQAFTDQEKHEMLKDKNIITGWYTSNRVPIDFSE